MELADSFENKVTMHELRYYLMTYSTVSNSIVYSIL